MLCALCWRDVAHSPVTHARTHTRPGTCTRSDGVLIAKVDADAEKELAGRFEVRGFPTLKWFPAGTTEPEEYSGGREAADFVEFINSKTGASLPLVSAVNGRVRCGSQRDRRGGGSGVVDGRAP